MVFGKSTLVLLMVVAGAQALQCYFGNKKDGNIAPKNCGSSSQYCVIYDSFAGPNSNTYAFCGDSLWCQAPGTVDQGTSTVTCCTGDLCNKVDAPVVTTTSPPKPLTCYAGSKSGGVEPKACGNDHDDYCVVYEVYPSGDNAGSTTAFCDHGLWCGQGVINQTGSEYSCCQSNLCNAIPDASPIPASTTPAAPLTCYSGNQNNGKIVEQLCPSEYNFCFLDHIYANADYPENYYGGCDNGLWCNQVINQTGSEYSCCKTNLCNVFPAVA